jgi:hypothetical protein
MTTHAPSIQAAIHNAIVDARRTCEQYGPHSKDCAVAWDTVEELQAEASHVRAGYRKKNRTSFESYCSQNPEAPECRVYDV